MSGTILFDGVCNLCNGFVRFVIARDPAARFRFAALTSPATTRILRHAGVSHPLPDSIVSVGFPGLTVTGFGACSAIRMAQRNGRASRRSCHRVI